MLRNPIRFILPSLTLSLLSALAVPAPAAALPQEWIAKWRADLVTARTALEKRHPSLFHSVTREALDSAFADLAARLPELEQHEAVVALAAIVAQVGDGHTRLTLPLGPGIEFDQGHSTTPPPTLPEMRFHQLPLRIAIDDQGPWIERIARRHRDLLGARITAVDGRPIDEVIAAVSPTIQRDNELQVLYHLPMHLVLPELLHARGMLADPGRAELTVRTPEGVERSLVLAPVAFDESIDWVGPLELGIEPPLSARYGQRNYDLVYLEAAGAVYVPFNVVYDEEEESIRDFASRLSSFIAEPAPGRPVEKLVLDLRRNRGGNGALLKPLLHAIIASPLNRTGRLYALIGRETFSAAMFLALDLEKQTEVIFVGEPTGTRPNHYGDSRKVQLPNTGLTLRISTLYWQSHPRDTRSAISPQLPVAVARDDVLAGRDPVIDTVLGLAAPATGVPWTQRPLWRGEVRTGSGAFPWALRIEPGDGDDRARVDLPALGVEGAQVEDLSLEAAGVGFVLPLGDSTMPFRGMALGERLFGTFDLGSFRLSFFLAPAEE